MYKVLTPTAFSQFPNRLSRKLRPVIGPNVFRHSPIHEQLRQSIQHVLRDSSVRRVTWSSMARHWAGCIHPVGLIIERPFRHGFGKVGLMHEVIAPDVILVSRSLTERRIHHEATVSFVSAVWTGLSAPPVSTTSPPACDSLPTLPNEAWQAVIRR